MFHFTERDQADEKGPIPLVHGRQTAERETTSWGMGRRTDVDSIQATGGEFQVGSL